MNIDALCHLPLFAGVDRQDLDWLFGTAERIHVKKDEILMREGDRGGSLYLILEGEFEFTTRSGPQQVVIARRGEGEVIGEISLLDESPRSATARAVKDSELLMIGQESFRALLAKSPSASLAILRTITSRLRNSESMLRQSEKMAALGTLAAGLAHELNNPAAAARRSASQLHDVIDNWQRLSDRVASELGARYAGRVRQLSDEMARRAAAPAGLDPLERSDRESEIQTWLEEYGVDNAWDMAPALVEFGWDLPRLVDLSAEFDAEHISLIARWLGTGCMVYGLLDQIDASTGRISEIVKAVKSYSYLDQAPVQNVDIHEGLENTLVILHYKIKNGIQVTREYDRDLPHIQAYASELNQVWTNIIDNAIDAMKGKGHLVIRTRRQDPGVCVEIEDNGPGIPTEIQPRIFDPFFTTKPPGVGTGLGLNIAYNIVQRHRGTIRVTSKPGSTLFQVLLPLKLEQA